MSYSSSGRILFASVLLIATACGERPAVLNGDQGGESRRTLRGDSISYEEMANATYTGIYDEPVRLVGGRFEGEPFQPGGASRPTLSLLPEPFVITDIDGDGHSEGIGLLVESSGGSGSFVYLAVVAASDSGPRSLGTSLVGDRAGVTALELMDGEIFVSVTEPPPGGPMASPGRAVVRRWTLLDGALMETTPEET